MATLLIDIISKEKEIEWKGALEVSKKVEFGEVVKWDSLVNSYAGRNRGRLFVLTSGMSFCLSPKGNQDPDIIEEIFNLLILKVLQVLEGSF